MSRTLAFDIEGSGRANRGEERVGASSSLTLIQLSDTHIVPAGELFHGQIDTLANLRSALDAVEILEERVSGFVLTGDLADAPTEEGTTNAYRRLKGVLEPVAARLRAKVVYVPGNHDLRRAFRAELLARPAGEGPLDQVVWIGDLRVIAMDSTEPGWHHGELDELQLEWLKEELQQPSPGGTVLALHHPPVSSYHAVGRLLGLRQARALEQTIAGSDVRIVVSGHYHHGLASSLGTTPVWVSPATSCQADLFAEPDLTRAWPGAGFSRIDLNAGSVTAIPMMLHDPGTRRPPVYEVSVEQLARNGRAPAPIPQQS